MPGRTRHDRRRSQAPGTPPARRPDLKGREVNQMPSYISSLFAADRRREMVAHAEQHGRAHRLVALARASRRAGRADRRMRRAAREARQLRTELER